MTLKHLLDKLHTNLSKIEFNDVQTVINDHYDYQPSKFTNGLSHQAVVNEAGTNEGSCKIFAFGQLNNLTEEQTLSCFGDYYRLDVLQNPENDDHQNIRNFIKDGWAGIEFEDVALTLKTT